MTQLLLDFDGALEVTITAAKKTSTRATSAAAYNAAGHFSSQVRARIFAFLVKQREQGATDEEIQTALGMTGNTRPTKLGCKAVVWVPTKGNDQNA